MINTRLPIAIRTQEIILVVSPVFTESIIFRIGSGISGFVGVGSVGAGLSGFVGVTGGFAGVTHSPFGSITTSYSVFPLQPGVCRQTILLAWSVPPGKSKVQFWLVIYKVQFDKESISRKVQKFNIKVESREVKEYVGIHIKFAYKPGRILKS